MKNVENDLRGIPNKKFDEASKALNVIGSNPIFISKWRSGGTVDSADLKSSGQHWPCGFESHLRYKYILSF